MLETIVQSGHSGLASVELRKTRATPTLERSLRRVLIEGAAVALLPYRSLSCVAGRAIRTRYSRFDLTSSPSSSQVNAAPWATERHCRAGALTCQAIAFASNTTGTRSSCTSVKKMATGDGTRSRPTRNWAIGLARTQLEAVEDAFEQLYSGENQSEAREIRRSGRLLRPGSRCCNGFATF
jgi:hypothetical protein